MSNLPALPVSCNLAIPVKELTMGCDQLVSRQPSTNPTYGPGDRAYIEIANSAWLHPMESFLSGIVTFSGCTLGTTASVLIDGSCYSLVSSISIYNGTQLLHQNRYANRSWTTLRDLQTNSTAATYADSINLMSNGLEGATVCSATVPTGSSFPFSFCIPAPLIGTLSQKSLPLHYLSVPLRVEITFEAIAACTVIKGGSTATTLGTYQISNLAYNAKWSRFSPSIERELMGIYQQAPQTAIYIPSLDCQIEMKPLSAGSSTFGQRFNFNSQSMKIFLLWMTNSLTAIGSVSSSQTGRPITAKSFPGLQEYYVQIDGIDSYHVNTNSAGLTLGAGSFLAHEAYGHLCRALNSTSLAEKPGLITLSSYASSDITQAHHRANNGTGVAKCVLAYDGDRADENNQAGLTFMGTDIVGKNFCCNFTLSAAPAESQNIYGLMIADCKYKLVMNERSLAKID